MPGKVESVAARELSYQQYRSNHWIIYCALKTLFEGCNLKKLQLFTFTLQQQSIRQKVCYLIDGDMNRYRKAWWCTDKVACQAKVNLVVVYFKRCRVLCIYSWRWISLSHVG